MAAAVEAYLAALPADTTPGEGLKRVEMSYIGG